MARTGPFDIDYPRAVLVVLATVTVGALLVAASTSTVAFGAFNQAWDGASDLRAVADASGAPSEIVQNTTAYETTSAQRTVAVILSPETAYTTAEVTRIRSFVEAGGTLVIADDFGVHSNALLAGLGVRSRIDGRLVRDERFHYRSPAMPIARNVSTSRFTRGVDRLTLNHGTAVRPNGASVLIGTSEYAYRDANRNGALDDDETLGTYPVVTAERLGDGRVIVVGDPSALINVMLDRPGNRAFVRALFDPHERVLLDYSHAADLPPLAFALLTLRETPLLQLVIGGLGIALIALWERYPRGVSRVTTPDTRSVDDGWRLDSDDLVRVIARNNPDWQRERIGRLVQGIIINRGKSKEEDDG